MIFMIILKRLKNFLKILYRVNSFLNQEIIIKIQINKFYIDQKFQKEYSILQQNYLKDILMSILKLLISFLKKNKFLKCFKIIFFIAQKLINFNFKIFF